MQRSVLAAMIAVAPLLAFGPSQSQAQIPLFFAAGPTFANLVGDDVTGTSSKTGFFVAAGTSIPLNETFAIEPNIGYVQKGAEFSSGDFSLDYIEIPVFLSAYVPLNERFTLTLSAGPQIAFNVSCEEPDGEDCGDADDLKTTEFGILGAAVVSFPVSDRVMLAIGGGADFGMTDVIEDVDIRTRTYYLFAGFGIPLGG